MKPFIIPEMTFKRHSKSAKKAQFNRPHITFYYSSVVITRLSVSCIVSWIFNVE